MIGQIQIMNGNFLSSLYIKTNFIFYNIENKITNGR